MGRTIRIEGMIDPHVHLRDLDWSHKATFASETAAAVAGGYWAVFDMPNTPPTTTEQRTLRMKLRALGNGAICDYGVYFGASQKDNTGEYPGAAPDTCGLKIFNNATTGDLLIEDQAMRDRHYAAWPQEHLIAVHAEGEIVLDILKLVRKYRRRTHFLHISTAQEIAYLTAAKEEGLPVTVGVCPHHLYLTADDAAALGGFGRMKPELKSAADRESLWQAIENGVVDIVESDHAPHTIEEKQSDNPPFGVPGLETTLPLLLTAVHHGRLTLERAVDLVSRNVQRVWAMPCIPYTYTEVDVDAEYVISGKNLHTACGWSPFEGMRVRGKVTGNWIRGQQVYDGERVLVQPGYGENLCGGGPA